VQSGSWLPERVPGPSRADLASQRGAAGGLGGELGDGVITLYVDLRAVGTVGRGLDPSAALLLVVTAGACAVVGKNQV